MNIRKATKKDIKFIDEIYSDGSIIECKLQFPEISISKLKGDLKKYKSSRSKRYLKEMNSRKYYYIVAEEKDKIVGFGQAEIKSKDVGVLELIYVDKKFTKKGIGLKLLKELEKWLKLKKVKFIESGFYYNNSPSSALHKKAGYKPIRIKMRKKVRR